MQRGSKGFLSPRSKSLEARYRQCLCLVSESLQQTGSPTCFFPHPCTVSFPRICSFESYFQQQQAVSPFWDAACCRVGLEPGQSVPGTAPRPLRLLTCRLPTFKLGIAIIWPSTRFPFSEPERAGRVKELYSCILFQSAPPKGA